MKKRLIATLLMLCLGLSLVACGNGSDKDSENLGTENSQQAENGTETNGTEETDSVYRVKIVNEANEPMGGMLVLLCGKGERVPKMTNGDGVAEFPVDKIEDGYRIAIASLPKDCTYDSEDALFTDGKTEIVITIKAK